MKIFGLTELRRNSRAVLNACDRESVVWIERRDGRRYRLEPEKEPAPRVKWVELWAEHRKRIKEIFPEPIPEEQVRKVDRLIRGDSGRMHKTRSSTRAGVSDKD